MSTTLHLVLLVLLSFCPYSSWSCKCTHKGWDSNKCLGDPDVTVIEAEPGVCTKWPTSPDDSFKFADNCTTLYSWVDLDCPGEHAAALNSGEECMYSYSRGQILECTADGDTTTSTSCGAEDAKKCWKDDTRASLSCWVAKGCNWKNWLQECKKITPAVDCSSICGDNDGITDWKACENSIKETETSDLPSKCRYYSVGPPNDTAVCTNECGTAYKKCFDLLGCTSMWKAACYEIMEETTSTCKFQELCDAVTKGSKEEDAETVPTGADTDAATSTTVGRWLATVLLLAAFTLW